MTSEEKFNKQANLAVFLIDVYRVPFANLCWHLLNIVVSTRIFLIYSSLIRKFDAQECHKVYKQNKMAVSETKNENREKIVSWKVYLRLKVATGSFLEQKRRAFRLLLERRRTRYGVDFGLVQGEFLNAWNERFRSRSVVHLDVDQLMHRRRRRRFSRLIVSLELAYFLARHFVQARLVAKG